MRIIKTTDGAPTDTIGQLAWYNSYDCLSLYEIAEGILSELTPTKLATYQFEMHLQASLLSMSFAGLDTDPGLRLHLTQQHEQEKRTIESHLHTLCEAIGYYDYYLELARVRYSTQVGVPLEVLPRSWSEWLAMPISQRRQLKSLNIPALAEFQKALKEFAQPFNGNSPAQKLRLFYHFFGSPDNQICQDTYWYCPPPWSKTRGITEVKARKTNNEYGPSTDRGALEKIALRGHEDERDAAYWARPFVSCCLALADYTKALGFLRCRLEQGKFKYTFGSVTETGRLNSKANAQGYGSNSQNVAPRLRIIFTCRSPLKLAAIDYGQIESRWVAARCFVQFGATAYWNAVHCLTEDHEVLTPDGWVPISTHPLVIANWDMAGNIKFERVLAWHSGIADELVDFESKAFSLRGTLNHKMPMIGDRSKRVQTTTLGEMATKFRQVVPVSGATMEQGGIGEERARLLAAFQADGTISNYVEFSFSKQRKVERLLRLLDAAQIPYWTNTFPPYSNQTKPTTRIYVKKEDWTLPVLKEAGSYLLEWDYISLRAYMEEHEYWDASSETLTSYRLTNKSKDHLMWLGTAAHLVGMMATPPTRDHGSWRINIRQNDKASLQQGRGSTTIIQGEYSVHCPTTNTGFFLTRRHGYITVSGNSGDLHTLAASMVWPDLPWPSEFTIDYLEKHGAFPADMLKAAKKLASAPFYRGKSQRDVSKILGHGTSYCGKPPQMSKHSHIEIPLIEHYQSVFFEAFPEVKQWHLWVAEQIMVHQELTTLMGRTRQFFGRPSDDSVIRAAVAFDPQSSTADYVNQALIALHAKQLEGFPITLRVQKHDEIIFTFEQADEEWLIPEVCAVMEHPVELVAPDGRKKTLIIPAESETGWNLARRSETNPDGLTHPDSSRVRVWNPFNGGLLG